MRGYTRGVLRIMSKIGKPRLGEQESCSDDRRLEAVLCAAVIPHDMRLHHGWQLRSNATEMGAHDATLRMKQSKRARLGGWTNVAKQGTSQCRMHLPRPRVTTYTATLYKRLCPIYRFMVSVRPGAGKNKIYANIDGRGRKSLAGLTVCAGRWRRSRKYVVTIL